MSKESNAILLQLVMFTQAENEEGEKLPDEVLTMIEEARTTMLNIRDNNGDIKEVADIKLFIAMIEENFMGEK